MYFIDNLLYFSVNDQEFWIHFIIYQPRGSEIALARQLLSLCICQVNDVKIKVQKATVYVNIKCYLIQIYTGFFIRPIKLYGNH